ncbi:uncharacterized protein LOC104581645 [Brachypodium distachyon]|uniref:uncharacterized protein LOC104581645 n=1 Tax=Brachypodium distachyon TaxID=15368 RepID=UPI000D0D8116|nr:uncharacterized protein LOC104581645 [Brachypodium distachyon]|eukprot:XP_024317949.1 uncharacterized protein LOC104581645 [Brachypodium distachyon]
MHRDSRGTRLNFTRICFGSTALLGEQEILYQLFRKLFPSTRAPGRCHAAAGVAPPPRLPSPSPLLAPLRLLHHIWPSHRPPLFSAPRPQQQQQKKKKAPRSLAARHAGDAGFVEELDRLLVLLPGELRRRVEGHPELPALVELVMDLGRPPLARFPSGDFLLSHRPISFVELHHATAKLLFMWWYLLRLKMVMDDLASGSG